jgi:hypothetical protein
MPIHCDFIFLDIRYSTTSFVSYFCAAKYKIHHSLYSGLRLQGGVSEGVVADLLRNALCFSSAKQRTDSEQTSKEDEGAVGLKSRSFEYSEIRWNM